MTNWVSGTALGLLLMAQGPFSGKGTAANSHPLPCVPPTMTSRWTAAASTIMCGGVTCTNGANVDAIPDIIAANNATPSATGYTTYVSSAVNGKPGVATNTVWWNLTTPFAPPTSMTWYAIVNFATSGGDPLFSGGTTPPEWGIGSAQYLNNNGVQVAGSPTGLALSTWYAIGFTYNSSTGNGQMYKFSGGSALQDGPATVQTTTFTGNIDRLVGNAGYRTSATIAEMGYLNGETITGIANWARCNYGI